MYFSQPTRADSATINPAALNSPVLSNVATRGQKRNRSPDSHDAPQSTGGDGVSSAVQRKRTRVMKSTEPTGQTPSSSGPAAAQPPQTPQTQSTSLPSQATPAFANAPAPTPPKSTPTKAIKALPTVRDHTTDQLSPSGDEYIPREIDEFGEKKVMPNGQLLGNRQYRCRIFLVPHRGDKLFMLATECARVLGYRDSYLLFNKNRSLYKIIASQAEKDDLVHQEILPFSYRSRQIAIVTARSMFRQFGSRVIENGRRVRDDYWETKARKQGFTEADPAGEKRPGAAKAREAAEAAQNNMLMSGPHPEIVYNSGPYPTPSQPHLVQAGMMGATSSGGAARMPGLTVGAEFNDTRPRDFGGIIKGGPRQEITGPPYQDQTRPSPLSELHSQAHNAAEFNRSVNQQRDIRGECVQGIWRRTHEQPASSSIGQQAVSGGSNDSNAPAANRPPSSPHTAPSGVAQQSTVVTSQSPQMMMTTPYSQSMHAPNTLGQAPMRSRLSPDSLMSRGSWADGVQAQIANHAVRAGSSGSIGQGASGYNYQSSQAMWSQSPQSSYHNFASYTTQAQSPHPSQSPASHIRQPSSGQLQPSIPFPGMSAMQYGAGQGMYPAEQTPRQYMPQSGSGGSTVTQSWSGQQQQQPQQHQQQQHQQQQHQQSPPPPPPPQWWAPPQQPQ